MGMKKDKAKSAPLRERAPREAEAPSVPAPPGTSLTSKVSASVGIVAAMVLAVLVNVLSARHYVRWDWTSGGLYTLSDATRSTLVALEEPVEVYVLLSADDPLALTLEQLLESYRAESPRILVRKADPDRHRAEFLAAQERFGIVQGKTDDGRVVADAALVVHRAGSKPHFITKRDLVEVEQAEDVRARPRLEQALTGGIRSVVDGDRPKVCFSTGHGEMSLDTASVDGVAALRQVLVKNNYEVEELPPASALGAERDPLAACRLLVMAGPADHVPSPDVARFKAFVEGGGSALIAVRPPAELDDKRGADVGIDDLLALGGVKLGRDVVFEKDPSRRPGDGEGLTFFPEPRPHAITEALLQPRDKIGPVVTVATSLLPTGGAAAPAPLLVTTPAAFGMVEFAAWARRPTAPVAGSGDHKGPLTVAYATELPKPPGGTAPHGPRLVILGSRSALVSANWQDPRLYATAVFVESALSWLAARPAMVDIPDKPAALMGMRLTEESLAAVFRYVVVFIPLASVLMGVAVYLRRRNEPRGAEGS